MRKLSLVLSGITIALQHDWNMVVNLALRVHICYRHFQWTETVFQEGFFASWTWLISCAVIYSKNFTNQSTLTWISLWCLQYLYLVSSSCKPSPCYIFLIINVKNRSWNVEFGKGSKGSKHGFVTEVIQRSDCAPF